MTTMVADATAIPLADDSVKLIVTSPPYCDARTYGINAQRDCAEWIDWMLKVVAECVRVCVGPVIMVAASVTRDRNYWPACEGLMYEWWRRGGSMYRPAYWHRVGIPGSGGDDWLRADVEYVMCFKRPGALPSFNVANIGHAPKWAPGGEMSHRLSDGTRRNQWGGTEKTTCRVASGDLKYVKRPGHRFHTKRTAHGDMQDQSYAPPAIANPGNLIRVKVGGGLLGDPLAHKNEAPFPEKLVEFFILGWSKPGDVVYDPFIGSGTTKVVADRHGRIGIGSDLRMSQCQLTRVRSGNDTKMLWAV